MLTYNSTPKVKRKDPPWLLFILALIWVLGTAFFHSPWEPYEPFVFAVVKGIMHSNSWLVPYVSSAPYLEIQPFYFWIYAAVIRLFGITDIAIIANVIRVINTLIIFAVLVMVGRIGSGLSSYKNGRTVILILISSIGFINTAYQLSPNILILLGLCFYLYALQKHRELPGISGWLLFIGLLLLSINFTCEFILIAGLILILLPIIDKHWRSRKYFVTCAIGVFLFLVIFYLYCIQLQQVNNEFFIQWQSRYTSLLERHEYNFWVSIWQTIKLLVWYVIPSWFLVMWTIYRRRSAIFSDKIIQVNILLAIILFLFTGISGKYPESAIFPIVIAFAFIASIEVDSIRITIVSLLNWFSIFIFGLIGTVIWLLYVILNISGSDTLVNSASSADNFVVKYIAKYSQDYLYRFNVWDFLLAGLISMIWLFMITRRHIRGREMITNWASGVTFVIVLFLSLWLPAFDSALTFKPIVNHSLKYIDKDSCVATNGDNGTQIALWYYYADISLMPSFINLDFSLCNQAVVATEDISIIDKKQWKIMWHGKRPIDRKVYYVIKHK
ncbi:MAG: hypothetical protein LW807_01595 [Proteobacteria bacterium]|jgi:4-amino-4-deoxy-L-arabinose transferase-like glycosyltransferase|nr:hypothetical protein [Pseudomonadota bacterium]